MTVTFRPEGPADEPLLRGTILAAIAEQLGAADWPEPMRTHLLGVQYATRRQAVRMGESLIILADEHAAGWVVLARSDGEVRVVDIIVAPEFRGQGIATEVLKRVIQDAAQKPVRLSVAATNMPAAALYQKLGFQRTGGNGAQHFLEYRGGSSR